jgi:hypothetical protein
MIITPKFPFSNQSSNLIFPEKEMKVLPINRLSMKPKFPEIRYLKFHPNFGSKKWPNQMDFCRIAEHLNEPLLRRKKIMM